VGVIGRLKWRRGVRRWCEMSAYVLLLVYAFIVGYAAAALFVAINRLEPNYWFARVLQVLVVLAAAAAIINRLLS
jgi:hypothetical protein